MYEHMMPEFVVESEKTIKARLQVEGFLRKWGICKKGVKLIEQTDLYNHIKGTKIYQKLREIPCKRWFVVTLCKKYNYLCEETLMINFLNCQKYHIVEMNVELTGQLLLALKATFVADSSKLK